MPDEQPATWSLTEKQALDMLAFLASAAEISLHEPTYYGTFRLIDAASRMMGYLLESNPELAESFMPEWKADIDQRKVWMMWDRPAYYQFLKETPAVIAAEVKAREEAAE
jgi:hypothetical protein